MTITTATTTTAIIIIIILLEPGVRPGPCSVEVISSYSSKLCPVVICLGL